MLVASVGMSSLGLLSDVSELINNGDLTHKHSFKRERKEHEKSQPVTVQAVSQQTDLNLMTLDAIFADYQHLANREYVTRSSQTPHARKNDKSAQTEPTNGNLVHEKKQLVSSTCQAETLTGILLASRRTQLTVSCAAPRINKSAQVAIKSTSNTESVQTQTEARETITAALDNLQIFCDNCGHRSKTPEFFPKLSNLPQLSNESVDGSNDFDESERIVAKYLSSEEKEQFRSNLIKTATIKRCSQMYTLTEQDVINHNKQQLINNHKVINSAEKEMKKYDSQRLNNQLKKLKDAINRNTKQADKLLEKANANLVN